MGQVSITCWNAEYVQLATRELNPKGIPIISNKELLRFQQWRYVSKVILLWSLLSLLIPTFKSYTLLYMFACWYGGDEDIDDVIIYYIYRELIQNFTENGKTLV